MTKVNLEITARARAERLALVRAELLRRLRAICAHMSDDMFLELVDSMAAVQLKYEMHEGSARTRA